MFLSSKAVCPLVPIGERAAITRPRAAFDEPFMSRFRGLTLSGTHTLSDAVSTVWNPDTRSALPVTQQGRHNDLVPRLDVVSTRSLPGQN